MHETLKRFGSWFMHKILLGEDLTELVAWLRLMLVVCLIETATLFSLALGHAVVAGFVMVAGAAICAVLGYEDGRRSAR
jgi:hypothetical protein